MPDAPEMDAVKPLDADELAYVRGQIETIRKYELSAGRHAAPAEHTASRLLATLDALMAEHDACVEKVGHSLTCPRGEPHDA